MYVGDNIHKLCQNHLQLKEIQFQKCMQPYSERWFRTMRNNFFVCVFVRQHWGGIVKCFMLTLGPWTGDNTLSLHFFNCQ